MKLQFLGANRQVTGSCYGLQVGDKRIMVDCGMFQERAYASRNWDKFPFDPSDVDALVLTHAHIDHCGRLPRLVRDGFNAPIYCTTPTDDLLDIMLKDAAKIQLEDVKYKKKRHKKEGRTSKFPYEPLYDEKDVENTLQLVKGVPYSSTKAIADGVLVTFHEAGHILGSSSIELRLTSGNTRRRVIFSGDIGQWGKPLIRDPATFESADVLIMESTYGDRNHTDGGDIQQQLCDVINDTCNRGGKVVIPTFAVERAQELMYFIGRLVHNNRIPDIPIYLDSPMAVDVTKVFHAHRDKYDTETWELIAQGIPPLRFPGLHMVRSTDDSKSINNVEGPAVIMSTSGMCTAGRIKHHLQRNISNRNSTILFVGFQGRGTLGRQIQEGKKPVRIHGRKHEVRARVAQIYGFSGHADRDALLKWAGSYKEPPAKVFLTHGEEDSAMSLAGALAKQGWNVTLPEYLSEVELT